VRFLEEEDTDRDPEFSVFERRLGRGLAHMVGAFFFYTGHDMQLCDEQLYSMLILKFNMWRNIKSLLFFLIALFCHVDIAALVDSSLTMKQTDISNLSRPLLILGQLWRVPPTKN
jgi:hypothetical protein